VEADAGRYTIIVGVDGSESSQNALRWAIEEATLRRGRIVAVHAWQPPIPPVGLGPTPFGDFPALLADVKSAAETLVTDIVAKVVGDDTKVAVEPKAIEGSPASVLIDESANADLLVVGSRGHGGFVGLLLGSVSQHCVNHAPCPVLVHRASRE
jgi:nucleotide-binding universal stress UspA family protein